MTELERRLDAQMEIITTLQETTSTLIQTNMLLKNDILNLNSYVAFLTKQTAMIATGQPVPELLSVVQSYEDFKNGKTH